MKNKYVPFREVSPDFFYAKNISNLKYGTSDNALYFTLDEDQYKIDNVHSIKNEENILSGEVISCDFEYLIKYRSEDTVHVYIKMLVLCGNSDECEIVIEIIKSYSRYNDVVEDIPVYINIHYGIYHEFLIEFIGYADNIVTYSYTGSTARYHLMNLEDSRIAILDMKIKNNTISVHKISYGINGIINKYLNYDQIKEIVPDKYINMTNIIDCKRCFKIIAEYINNS